MLRIRNLLYSPLQKERYPVLYALRKLIAFVFLGGIFWFIYSDPAEIGSPVFMHALGVITVLFAVFWLVVPMLVVRLRIRKRERQNEERYQDWKIAIGKDVIHPLSRKVTKLELAEGERVFLHEKGTLYAPAGVGFDEMSAKGKPGDVAFPGMRRNTRKIQRTHCYLTDRQIILVGKMLKCEIGFAELKKFLIKPGGLVFLVEKDGKRVELAFTFPNPLVAAEYLNRLTSGVGVA